MYKVKTETLEMIHGHLKGVGKSIENDHSITAKKKKSMLKENERLVELLEQEYFIEK
jgi:hypothetical protein